MEDSSVPLTPHQQALINDLVESGRYAGANDVVAAGLRLLEEKEAHRRALIETMESAIAEGLASGPSTDLDIDAIIAKAEAERQENRG